MHWCTHAMFRMQFSFWHRPPLGIAIISSHICPCSCFQFAVGTGRDELSSCGCGVHISAILGTLSSDDCWLKQFEWSKCIISSSLGRASSTLSVSRRLRKLVSCDCEKLHISGSSCISLKDDWSSEEFEISIDNIHALKFVRKWYFRIQINIFWTNLNYGVGTPKIPKPHLVTPQGWIIVNIMRALSMIVRISSQYILAHSKYSAWQRFQEIFHRRNVR